MCCTPVFCNDDGSSDLQLVIYPFHYRPATTDGRFYRHWRFDAHTVETDVSLELLDAPPVAEPGDTVALSLDLQNDGDAQDVVVGTAVTFMNGEPLDGLLRTLYELQGNAEIDLAWNTIGAGRRWLASPLPARGSERTGILSLLFGHLRPAPSLLPNASCFCPRVQVILLHHGETAPQHELRRIAPFETPV